MDDGTPDEITVKRANKRYTLHQEQKMKLADFKLTCLEKFEDKVVIQKKSINAFGSAENSLF